MPDLNTQQEQTSSNQDQTSNNVGNFPSSEIELFSSSPTFTEKTSPTKLAEDLGEAGKAGAVLYIQSRSSGRIA